MLFSAMFEFLTWLCETPRLNSIYIIRSVGQLNGCGTLIIAVGTYSSVSAIDILLPLLQDLSEKGGAIAITLCDSNIIYILLRYRAVLDYRMDALPTWFHTIPRIIHYLIR